MARGGRELVEWPKACPACGRAGTATYEEAESPPHRGQSAASYSSDLVRVSLPFKMEQAAEFNIIRCECGQEIP